MKKFLLFIVTAVFSVSCVPVFYQVYKTSTSDQLNIVDSKLVYEDQNISIAYNLWGENGNIGFSFYNNTDDNIYFVLCESYFILNGYANNYFRNRTFTQTLSALQSSTIIPYSRYFISSYAISASKGYSTSFIEERVVCIPSKTTKNISEYSINDVIIRNCDLFLYPTNKQINTKIFPLNESPLVFSNRIAYSIGAGADLITIENKFFVSEITNYPQASMEYQAYEEICGKKSSLKKTYLRNVSPDNFYIKYTTLLDMDSKH